MGTLEPEFQRLHWPPLVREVVQTVTYPGYRYELFRSFRELDAFFTEMIGEDWRNEAWAEFWIGQHKDTQVDDRREWKEQPKIFRARPREMLGITKLAVEYLNENPKTSSYKLVAWLKTQDIHITQPPAWRIIKKWKANPDYLIYDDTVQKYLSTAYTQNVITPLGTPIPAGYTKEQWRKDWNEKHGLG